MTDNVNRVPSGVPTGGQFAASAKAESAVSLTQCDVVLSDPGGDLVRLRGDLIRSVLAGANTPEATERAQAAVDRVLANLTARGVDLLPDRTPKPRKSVWAENDDERAAFQEWVQEASNGDTAIGFREWYENPDRLDAGLDTDDED